MDERTTKHFLFQTSDAAAMMNGVTPRTLRRWASSGSVLFDLDEMNNRRLFPLEEINRIRSLQKLPPLSNQEAIDIFGNRHIDWMYKV